MKNLKLTKVIQNWNRMEGTQEESFDDANMMEAAVSDLFVATRSGRTAKSWRCSYFRCK